MKNALKVSQNVPQQTTQVYRIKNRQDLSKAIVWNNKFICIGGLVNCQPGTLHTFLILFRIWFCSQLTNLKTGWKWTEWPCVEPLHYHQEDGYNCGVIICLVIF